MNEEPGFFVGCQNFYPRLWGPAMRLANDGTFTVSELSRREQRSSETVSGVTSPS